MKFRTIDSCSQQPNNNFTIIRLIAALLVIYGHSYAIVGSNDSDLILKLLHVRYAGSFAVDIFFIISGFLICASWERNTFQQFAVARVLRIYPALIICMFFCVFILGFSLSTEPSYFLHLDVWKYFGVNITLLKSKFYLPGVFEIHPNKAINGSIWSLPYEIRLYACLALIGALGLLKSWRYLFLCIAIVLAYFLDFFSHLPFLNNTNFQSLAVFFIAGAFCWVYRKFIVLSLPILILMIIGCVVFYKSEKFIYCYFITVIYATFYLVYIPRLKWNPRADVSYGVYLYGWPVQQLVLQYIPGCSAECNAIVSMIFAVVFGYLSWTFVESPALGLRKRISSSGKMLSI